MAVTAIAAQTAEPKNSERVGVHNNSGCQKLIITRHGSGGNTPSRDKAIASSVTDHKENGGYVPD